MIKITTTDVKLLQEALEHFVDYCLWVEYQYGDAPVPDDLKIDELKDWDIDAEIIKL